MHSIAIDDEVFADLAARATGFNVTPNAVLRRILGLPTADLDESAISPLDSGKAETPQSLVGFIRTQKFQRHQQTVDRFLLILGWLHAKDAKVFATAIMGFQRGKRLYFARSKSEILKNGANVTAKPIPQSPFWALTTLDNKSKRLIIEDLLSSLKYSRSEIQAVMSELPDSGIRRSHGPKNLGADF